MLEEDSSRKEAFEHELEHIQNELDRLNIRASIPEDLSGVFIPVQVNAIHVLKSMVDLVAIQLAYLQTFLARFGK